MVRVSNGFARHRKHRKLTTRAKGFRLGRSTVYKQIRLALIKQGTNAYRGRKLKKRTFRNMWIERLGAVLRNKGTSYSAFMGTMRKNHTTLNRKVLSNIAVAFPEVFDHIYTAITKK